mgnify:CR=1 FL=1
MADGRWPKTERRTELVEVAGILRTKCLCDYSALPEF